MNDLQRGGKSMRNVLLGRLGVWSAFSLALGFTLEIRLLREQCQASSDNTERDQIGL